MEVAWTAAEVRHRGGGGGRGGIVGDNYAWLTISGSAAAGWDRR